MALSVCPKCGHVVSKKAVQCPSCGFETGQYFADIYNKKMTKMAKIMVVVIVIAFLVSCFLRSSIYEVILVEAGVHDKANACYEELSEGATKKAQKIIDKKMDAIYDQYANETITYDDANRKLQKYQYSNIAEDYLKTSQSKLDLMKASKDGYTEAKKFQTDGKLDQALEAYSKVIPEDKNYQAALNGIKEVNKDYSKYMIKKSREEAKVGRYDNAIAIIEDLESKYGVTNTYENIITSYKKSIETRKIMYISITGTPAISGNTLNVVFNMVNTSNSFINFVSGQIVASDAEGNEIFTAPILLSNLQLESGYGYDEYPYQASITDEVIKYKDKLSEYRYDVSIYAWENY